MASMNESHPAIHRARRRGRALKHANGLSAPLRTAQLAVSLPEVLIVISIIVFLLALLLPGMGHARELVRRAQCRANLRSWGAAAHLYRNDWKDHLPEEGSFLPNVFGKPNNWFNALPPYLGLPRYADFEGVNATIKELPNAHVWICPSKNLTGAYKSGSGKNQIHYGMNQVLDGMGTPNDPSEDTPDFPDADFTRCEKNGDNCKDMPLSAATFAKRPNTVLIFDILPNSPAGSPRDVATELARGPNGERLGKFHGDYANFLYLHGGVDAFATADLVENADLRRGPIRWLHPQLYWGYPASSGWSQSPARP
jgi:type II secretory pathway pseudopilin PulG